MANSMVYPKISMYCTRNS